MANWNDVLQAVHDATLNAEARSEILQAVDSFIGTLIREDNAHEDKQFYKDCVVAYTRAGLDAHDAHREAKDALINYRSLFARKEITK